MECLVSHLIFGTEKDEVHYRMLTAIVSPRQSKTGKKTFPFLDPLWLTQNYTFSRILAKLLQLYDLK